MDNPEKGQASALHKSVPGPAYSPSQPQALRTDSSGHSDAQISRDQHSAKPQLGESSEKKKGIEEHYGDIVERNWNLFGAPWATTNGDDSRGSEWSREKGGEAISELHRFNIGKARLALYKDYIKIANQGEETGDSEECEGQTSLAR
jgi:hypothetical protein